MNLEQLLDQQARQRAEVEAVLQACAPQVQSVVSQLLAANHGLEEQLRQTLLENAELKRMLFGSKSEKLSPEEEELVASVQADLQEAQCEEQSPLSAEVLEEEPQPPQSQTEEEPPAPDKKNDGKDKDKKKPRPRPRHPMPEHLERQTTVIDVAEKKDCPHCGRPPVCIGQEVTEELDYVPARIVVRRIERPKYACRCGECGVELAPLPPRLLPQSKLGLGLAVHLLLSRFDDHVSYYTLERTFLERHGVNIPRQQMVQWVEHIAFLLQPLCLLMFQQMKSGGYLQIDETPVKVMDPEIKGRCARGYLWFYAVPGGDVFVDFQDTRGRKAPHAQLEGFHGTIQTDAYEVYDSLKKVIPGLIRIGCVAHLRRLFHAALLAADTRSVSFIVWMRQLYQIEKEARSLEPQQRQLLRQDKAPPIWETMNQHALELKPSLLPQSRMGKAVNYLINEWEPLRGYLKDGRFEIDNNLVENAIRTPAVGRRRWLFIGHPDAGWRSAVIYSMIISCRRRGINPQDYLSDVLRRLPAMKIQEIGQLLPHRWKPLPASGG